MADLRLDTHRKLGQLSDRPQQVRSVEVYTCVSLGCDRIDALPAHARMRRGLARTFQSLELYDDLSVEEDVSAAVCSTAHEHRSRHVIAALERAISRPSPNNWKVLTPANPFAGQEH